MTDNTLFFLNKIELITYIDGRSCLKLLFYFLKDTLSMGYTRTHFNFAVMFSLSNRDPLCLYCFNVKTCLEKHFFFINNLPRLHFWAIIALFFFLLFVSLIPPSDHSNKNIKRELTLPISDSLKGGYAIAEPQNVIRDNSDKLFPDFSGNREVEITISSGDTLSEIFSNESISAAVLQELLEADTEYLRLANLIPGQVVQLLVSPDNQLLALKIIIDRANT